jgi:FAD/FMN-containing dehydrogenase
VPFDQLASFMKRADGWLQRAGIERVARFGHVGNGHPHYNLMLRDAEEVLQAEQVVARMCEEACGLGGTITAEHGVGKVKRPYLRHRFGDLELASMRAIKELMDPSQLLAPENLFP